MRTFIGLFFFLFTSAFCFCQSTKSFYLLDSISKNISNTNYVNIDAVVISQNGKVIYQDYFHGFGKDSLHDTRSSFKSITGILTGIALDKKYIRLDDRVYSFFPEYKKKENWDKRKDSITIRNLLEMKSGYDCEEFFDTKICEDAMSASNNWIKFSLDLPLISYPGKIWSYSSTNMVILGGIIARASGMTVQEFSDNHLFSPLGIKNYRWTTDPKGNGMTAGSFYISPLDMLKIGELVLNKGIWENKRIISETWIKEMTQPITKIDGFSFVGSSRTKLAIAQPTYYGYTWYSEKIKTDKMEEPILFASGNGGQYIMIMEKLNAVVIFTGSNYDSWRSKQPFELLIKYILPYLRG